MMRLIRFIVFVLVSIPALWFTGVLPIPEGVQRILGAFYVAYEENDGAIHAFPTVDEPDVDDDDEYIPDPDNDITPDENLPPE